MRIEEADKNFAVNSSVQRDGLTFFDIEQAPFCVHGVKKLDGRYRRLPEELAKRTSAGVHLLHANTAGGRVRFATDSPYIVIHYETDFVSRMPHFPLTGCAGFDLHAGSRYLGTYVPPMDLTDGYDSVIDLPEEYRDGKVHDYTIHFPLYSDVCSLYIGLQQGSTLTAAKPYTHALPVVYYGSSITQGGCASRPGNAYENIISLELDCDHLNLGFSGNAKGEDCICEYIASLPMSVFVCDYDHNAPTLAHLQATHEKLFLTVREKQPLLPVIFMSRPQPYLNAEEKQRLAVVRTTYENALARGDKNVYFLSGNELLNLYARNTGLVDNCHPNDSGFVSIAFSLMQVLRPVLEK